MVYGTVIGASITETPTSAKEVLDTACKLVLNEVSERWSVTNTFFSFIGSNV